MTFDELKEMMETGEEFDLRTAYDYYENLRFDDSDPQLYIKTESGGIREFRMSLNDILNAKLIRKPWKPKVGEEYWSWWIGSDNRIVIVETEFVNSSSDMEVIAFGNCFRKKEECESHPEIRDKLLEMRKEYA